MHSLYLNARCLFNLPRECKTSGTPKNSQILYFVAFKMVRLSSVFKDSWMKMCLNPCLLQTKWLLSTNHLWWWLWNCPTLLPAFCGHQMSMAIITTESDWIFMHKGLFSITIWRLHSLRNAAVFFNSFLPVLCLWINWKLAWSI